MKLSLKNDLTEFLHRDRRIAFLFIRAVVLSLLLAICISTFFLCVNAIECGKADMCNTVKVSNQFVHDLTFAFLLLVLPIIVYALILVRANQHLQQLKPYLAILFPCWVGYAAAKINAFNLIGYTSLQPQTTLEYVFLSSIIFGLAMILRKFFWERG
jgi:hypothetical protein